MRVCLPAIPTSSVLLIQVSTITRSGQGASVYVFDRLTEGGLHRSAWISATHIGTAGRYLRFDLKE
jgi:hypothetical protein